MKTRAPLSSISVPVYNLSRLNAVANLPSSPEDSPDYSPKRISTVSVKHVCVRADILEVAVIDGNNKPSTNKTVLAKTNQPDGDFGIKKLAPPQASLLETEIAKRKFAEERLRLGENELRDFIENAMFALRWIGPDGTILWANQAELDLLGYSKEEYIGRHIGEFHVDREVVDDVLRRFAEKETLRDYEARLRCKDGSIRHVLISSNAYWENGEFVHTRCFTRDISERKQGEAASARLAAIVASSSDAIIGKTLEGIITS